MRIFIKTYAIDFIPDETGDNSIEADTISIQAICDRADTFRQPTPP